MADFIGNPVPNCTQNFINMGGHSAAAAIGGSSTGGFMQMQHDQFGAVQMLASRSYDGGEAAAARVAMNAGGGGGGAGGGYGFGYSSTMGVAEHSGLGSIGSGPFFKSGMAGGDERSTAAQ